MSGERTGEHRRELVAPWFHRPLARRLLDLLPNGVAPIQLTASAFAISCLAAVLYAPPMHTAKTIAAGGVLLVATVLDAGDGELARRSGRVTARGAWLDTMLDRVADVSIAFAITWSYAAGHDWPFAWPLGLGAHAATVLLSYGWKEMRIRFDVEPPRSILDLLSRRDARTAVLVAGTLSLQPFWTLVVIGAVALAALLRMFHAVVRRR